MLCDLYTTISVYRKGVKLSSFDDTTFSLNGTIQGFLQPRAGSYSQSNSSNNATSTDILYTDLGVDIVTNDRIELNSLKYQVQFIQPDVGIGGVLDHQEIPVARLNDV